MSQQMRNLELGLKTLSESHLGAALSGRVEAAGSRFKKVHPVNLLIEVMPTDRRVALPFSAHVKRLIL